LISDPIGQALREGIAARPVGVVQVKGKRASTRKILLAAVLLGRCREFSIAPPPGANYVADRLDILDLATEPRSPQ
jgi:hypothetical protein